MAMFNRYGRTLFFAAAVAALCLPGCLKKSAHQPASESAEALSATPVTYDTLLDPRDSAVYKTVVIGGRRWMAENLNYELDNSQCYDDKESNCKRYGRLYDWYTAMTVCPAGWHLSTANEWRALIAAAGGDSTDDTRLRAAGGWKEGGGLCGDGPCPDWVPGTDEFGFSALPGGYGGPDGGFANAGFYGYWWQGPSGGCDKTCITLACLKYYNGPVAERRNYSTHDSYSVRCVENYEGGEGTGSKCDPLDVACTHDYAAERRARLGKRVEELSAYFTDPRDGQTYRYVMMGRAAWMAENLNYAPKGGGSWCHQNNDCNCAELGRLYDWETAKTACPPDWRLPSREDWDSLAAAVGGGRRSREEGSVRWDGMSADLKSEHGWDPRFPVSWTDKYGFSALPNGHRKTDGGFSHIYCDGHAQWWSAEEAESDSGRIITKAFGYYGGNMDEYNVNRNEGWPVRCVRDAR
ncbi:hypothetical protein R80B4_03228 [Fibrobacteres bacterium R8-0-B4]